jgi:hypothetical protein
LDAEPVLPQKGQLRDALMKHYEANQEQWQDRYLAIWLRLQTWRNLLIACR